LSESSDGFASIGLIGLDFWVNGDPVEIGCLAGCVVDPKVDPVPKADLARLVVSTALFLMSLPN
jgi:hypothetical protein